MRDAHDDSDEERNGDEERKGDEERNGDDDTTSGDAGAEPPAADDPFDALDEAFDADSDDDPFADLDDVAAADDPFGPRSEDVTDDELFDDEEVEEMDEASVWAALGGEAGTTDVAVGGDLPDVETEAEEQVVPKRSYCETCEHFSTPPETACTHPGTEIRALVDMKHFTVVDCPVVARRRGIDGGTD